MMPKSGFITIGLLILALGMPLAWPLDARAQIDDPVAQLALDARRSWISAMNEETSKRFKYLRLQSVHEALQDIVNLYPDSEIAQKLKDGEPLDGIDGLTLEGVALAFDLAQREFETSYCFRNPDEQCLVELTLNFGRLTAQSNLRVEDFDAVELRHRDEALARLVTGYVLSGRLQRGFDLLAEARSGPGIDDEDWTLRYIATRAQHRMEQDNLREAMKRTLQNRLALAASGSEDRSLLFRIYVHGAASLAYLGEADLSRMAMERAFDIASSAHAAGESLHGITRTELDDALLQSAIALAQHGNYHEAGLMAEKIHSPLYYLTLSLKLLSLALYGDQQAQLAEQEDLPPPRYKPSPEILAAARTGIFDLMNEDELFNQAMESVLQAENPYQTMQVFGILLQTVSGLPHRNYDLRTMDRMTLFEETLKTALMEERDIEKAVRLSYIISPQLSSRNIMSGVFWRGLLMHLTEKIQNTQIHGLKAVSAYQYFLALIAEDSFMSRAAREDLYLRALRAADDITIDNFERVHSWAILAEFELRGQN